MRCSRCSKALVLPWHFEHGLCSGCLNAAHMDPLSMDPETFLRKLLDIAAESMDRETYHESIAKLELILLAIYPLPAQTYTSSTHRHTPTDTDWKRDTFTPTTEVM